MLQSAKTQLSLSGLQHSFWLSRMANDLLRLLLVTDDLLGMNARSAADGDDIHSYRLCVEVDGGAAMGFS